MTLEVLSTGADRQRIWRCDWCGRHSVWGEGWQWHGSWADEDDGNRAAITIVCSDACRRECVANGGLSEAPHSYPKRDRDPYSDRGYGHGYVRRGGRR